MDIRDDFRDAGLKFTIQRKIVYEAMRELCHASIEEVIAHVEQQNSGFTPSTVYRVLNTFCNAGLISRMSHPSGRCYYDINPVGHHHMFDEEGKIVDYDDPELTELIVKKLKDSALCEGDIERISIQIFTKAN